MAGDSLTTQDAPLFDASQFKLQDDGTFRISIRGMAAMAGVDHAGIVRSLKSAGDEKALPCARSLLAQGFCPGDVTGWGETGGIPEEAAPFILEHYAFTAAAPSQQARAVLLAFSRVGINAYLKDKLGVRAQAEAPAPVALPVEIMLTSLERVADLMDRFGGLDERDQLLFRDITRNTILRAAGTVTLLPASPDQEEMALSDAWLEVTGSPLPRSKYRAVGTLLANHYREEHDGEEPPKRTQFVDGAARQVNSYKRGWLLKTVKAIWERVRDN